MFADRQVEHFAVKSSWLQQSADLRLDASFYNPGVARALLALERSGFKIMKLGEVAERIFIPPRFKRIYVDRQHGIPFLQGGHVVHFQPADLKYLSRAVHRNLDTLLIHEDWLLVTRSGTVGRVALCPRSWDGWAASEHILRIVPKESADCPPGFLASYLGSPIGQAQLTAQIYGAVVDELTEEQARGVLVPVADSDEQRAEVRAINDVALRAVRLRAEAADMAIRAGADVTQLLPSMDLVEGTDAVSENTQAADERSAAL